MQSYPYYYSASSSGQQVVCCSYTQLWKNLQQFLSNTDLIDLFFSQNLSQSSSKDRLEYLIWFSTDNNTMMWRTGCFCGSLDAAESAALEEEDEEARLFILEFLFGLRLSFRLFARANRLEKFMFWEEILFDPSPVMSGVLQQLTKHIEDEQCSARLHMRQRRWVDLCYAYSIRRLARFQYQRSRRQLHRFQHFQPPGNQSHAMELQCGFCWIRLPHK